MFGSTSSSEVLEGISSIVFASSTSSKVFSANPSQNPFEARPPDPPSLSSLHLFISSSSHSQFFLTSFKSALLLLKAPFCHLFCQTFNSTQQPTWLSDLSLKLNLIEKIENSIDYWLFLHLPPPPHWIFRLTSQELICITSSPSSPASELAHQSKTNIKIIANRC